MPTITSGRLALATSSLALVVAMGGAGYAAATIGTAQIKNNAVTSAKIKNNNVTGSDVKESSLGKVPTAAKADSASSLTGGVTVREINYQRIEDLAPVVVFNTGGLSITASCTNATGIDIVATTNGPAFISTFVSTDSAPADPSQNDQEDFNFNPGETFDLLDGTAGNISLIEVNYFTRAGSSVTMSMVADLSGTECWLNGHAVVS